MIGNTLAHCEITEKLSEGGMDVPSVAPTPAYHINRGLPEGNR